MIDTVLDRIAAGVWMHPDTGCWIWQGALNNGYGVMGVGKKTDAVHRLAFERLVRPRNPLLTLDHEVCDETMCCNPYHLVEKPTWENTSRSKTNPFAIKARATECKHGHEFSAENTYIHPKRGTRHCRTCKRTNDRKYARAK